MRTLLLTPDFPPRRGGVARYLEAVASALKEEVTVYAPPEPDSAAFDASAPYRVVRTPLLSRFVRPRWLRALVLLWRRRERDGRVIVSHVLPFGTAAWIAGWFTGKPYVVIVHGMDVGLARRSPWKRWLAGAVLRGAASVIANSHALKDEVRAAWGVERVAFVHPAVAMKGEGLEGREGRVSSAGVRIQEPGVRIQEPAPIGRRPFVRLLTVARLVPRKGHLRVLEALARLRERGELPDGVDYLIVGDGPMKEAIERRAVELGVDDVVRFRHGAADEALPDIYRSSDVFVMPTVAGQADREGFGIVYLEAAAYGLPSVATRQPGVDEAVLDGRTGLLVPDGDAEALAQALLRLSTDAELRRTLGSAGQARVREEFTRGRQAEKLRRLLT